MKIGYSAVIEPVEKTMEEYAGLGYTHVEIDLYNRHSQPDTFTKQKINLIRDLAKKNNMSLSMHPAYSINLADPITELRDATVNYLKKCIGLANELNCTHMTIHLGHYRKWDSLEDSLDLVAGALEELLPACGNVPIALENSDASNTPGIIEIADLANLEYLLSRNKNAKLGFCLDTGHANTKEGAVKYIKALGNRLLAAHLHDNDGSNDEHNQLGSGSIDWKAVVEEFKKCGFNGPYISEIFGSAPEEFIRIWKNLW